jgi:deoxyxylulose-5-phosphate synthase
VLEAASDLALTCPVMHLGIPDCFVTHGATEKLLSDVGLTASAVRDAVVGRLSEVREKKGAGDGAHTGRRRAR